MITEASGACINVRGSYFPPSRLPKLGERRLHLHIESDNQYSVDKAKEMIKKVIEDAFVLESSSQFGGMNPLQFM